MTNFWEISEKNGAGLFIFEAETASDAMNKVTSPAKTWLPLSVKPAQLVELTQFDTREQAYRKSQLNGFRTRDVFPRKSIVDKTKWMLKHKDGSMLCHGIFFYADAIGKPLEWYRDFIGMFGTTGTRRN